jgi:hypothetical protein
VELKRKQWIIARDSVEHFKIVSRELEVTFPFIQHFGGRKVTVLNHDDALFNGECGGLLNDVLCAVHKTPP